MYELINFFAFIIALLLEISVIKLKSIEFIFSIMKDLNTVKMILCVHVFFELISSLFCKQFNLHLCSITN